MNQFIFWGLFLALGALVVAYLAWMVWANRNSIDDKDWNSKKQKQ